ncbi:hypothetical protein Poly30_39770 [Planctomycetes bacterium Poly30]|uniref:Carboxypeptidase regulatory-like domain-containing protein n=1 Tax=Saltatorellus ferox TaxID=2528018 RepID=A0A518EWG1_9BACT|nr:hypothetical protein Poly30_39770 [Planctomycetes bacterium Poly30]
MKAILAATVILVVAFLYWARFARPSQAPDPVDPLVAASTAGATPEASELGVPRSRNDGPSRAEGEVPGEKVREKIEVEDAKSGASESEEEPFVIPSGTVLMGRVVGSSGEPVDQASLYLHVTPSMVADWELTLDGSGRFALKIGPPGKIEFHVGHPEFGRSEDQIAWLEEGEATDAGTLLLLGSGSIRGRVQLTDGTPVPGVQMRAKGLGLGDPGGFVEGEATSDAAGNFHFQGLAEGLFELTARGREEFDSIGTKSFRTGETAAVLTLDAALIRLSLPEVNGEPVPIRWISLNRPSDGLPAARDFSGASSKTLGRSTLHYDLLLPAGQRVQVEAKDEAGHRFASVLGDGVLAGSYRVTLRPDRVPR